MKHSPIVLSATATIGLVALSCVNPHPAVSPERSSSPPAPIVSAKEAVPVMPVTRRQAIEEEIFGVKVEDPYRWLEQVESPEVQAWMAGQDQIAREVLDALPGREALRKRLGELLYVEQRSPPVHKQGRYFFSVKPADQEKAIHYVQFGKGGTPEVLLDPNSMSEDGSLSINSVSPSPAGKLVAYFEQPNNADESTLKIMTVDSRRVLEQDTIEGLRYTRPSWTPDGKGFYYTWLPKDPSIDPADRTGHAEVRFHRIGTDPKTDKTVHPKTGDPSKWIGGGVSKDGKYLLVSIGHGWAKNDLYFKLAADESAPFTAIAEGKEALYWGEVYRDRFYIITNEDAPRFRVFRVDPKRPTRERWVEVIKEDPEAVLEQADIVGGHLVLRYLRNAYTELQIRTLDGELVRQVELPAIGTASSFVGDEDEDEAYFSFSSFTYPNEIYRTSVKNGGRELFAKVEVPALPENFEVKQRWYQSKDGTRVSLFIIHKRGLELNGMNPTLLYGYGGFSASMVPSFIASLYPWLEAGGVWAMPNLRGGGEYGEAWHRAGMLENKQNVFDDFIAAAEYLIREAYTSPQHLAINGGSNGGLLVGAAMTQRPDLYAAVVCGVPLLDMLRYHKFGLGKAWVPEYGDPENADHFHFLHAYSPYHQVKQGTRYPALLMLSADTDDRVDPMHARKFVARVQAASSRSGRHSLLRIERNAGHGGGDMRKKYIARTVDEYAFLLSLLRSQ